MYEEEATSREKKISRNLAIGIHVLIVVLFVFGVSWHKRQAEPGAVADLWSTMTPPRQETPRPEPPLKLTPKIEKEPPPRPPPPPPKPEVKAQPKPDIALKEKLEKDRKVKEQLEKDRKVKEQQELERKREEEAKRLKAAELKKNEEEKRKLAEQQELERKKEEELKRLTAEKEAAAKQAAAQQTSARAAQLDRYKRLIEQHIKRRIVEPPNLQGNPEVEFQVIQIPGGDVLSVKMIRGSGAPVWDSAVERAILAASPLPMPPDPSLFERELRLKFRPKE